MKIAVMGSAGSGKDTLADYLVEKYNYKKCFFAKPIYEIGEKYFGMTTKNRELLQDIGQALRTVDKNVFINNILKEIKGLDNVVVSDVRQENEYKALEKEGFMFVRIESDLEVRVSRIEKRDNVIVDSKYINRIETHESETGANKYDAIPISNNKDLMSFYVEIDNLLKRESI